MRVFFPCTPPLAMFNDDVTVGVAGERTRGGGGQATRVNAPVCE